MTHTWTDNPTQSGTATCDTDVLNECLMHLKYDNKSAGANLLDCKWSDHILNDMSWLRSDTFSWQSGSVYTTAYNHLVSDISGITAETETIGSYTVTFYRATDGHKICLADQETIVSNIYTESGIAWYYILDTTNTRFKLPRMKYKYWKNQTTLPVKGNGMTLGLTNGTNNFGIENNNGIVRPSVSQYGTNVGTAYSGTIGFSSTATIGLTTDATKSGIVADVSDSIIETGFYLYFYVGEYTQTAIEQTAGITTEQLNNKVDINLGNFNTANLSDVQNTYFSGLGMPSSRYIDLTLGATATTYTAPGNGWFYLNKSATASNQFLLFMSDKGYQVGHHCTGSYQQRAIFPVTKDDVVTVSYTLAGTTNTFRFYYAEGESSS